MCLLCLLYGNDISTKKKRKRLNLLDQIQLRSNWRFGWIMKQRWLTDFPCLFNSLDKTRGKKNANFKAGSETNAVTNIDSCQKHLQGRKEEKRQMWGSVNAVTASKGMKSHESRWSSAVFFKPRSTLTLMVSKRKRSDNTWRRGRFTRDEMCCFFVSGLHLSSLFVKRKKKRKRKRRRYWDKPLFWVIVL